jgi:eukaryotic translation initiation factor 2C
MELCKTTPKHQKKLDERQTADIIKHTAVPANERMTYISNWAKSCDINRDPILREYNIGIDIKMIELQGRVLDPPDVEYGNNRIVTSNMIEQKGSWDHRNNLFAKTIELKSWAIINLATRVNDAALNSFIDKLIEIGKRHGMILQDPLDVVSTNKRFADAAEAKKLFENLQNKHNKSALELVIVIFSGTSNAYNEIKTIGDIKFGIVTQGVEDKNVNRLNDQTISNILLKINSKLGKVY